MESDAVIQISGMILDIVISLSSCLNSENGLENPHGALFREEQDRTF
jgi:hypothetical protein